jgi:hypothetical protein
MLTTNTQPLDIAARILTPQTMLAVRRSSAFHLRGWAILDRWALNSPDKLRELERQGEVVLLGRLLEQQQMEHQALTAAMNGPLTGMAEHEILAAYEIQTEL